jgi:hypothetical protein
MEKLSNNPPLEPGKIYHVYNRANGDEDIFLSKWNYLYFLDKFKLYISPICDVYAYCLLPNHFHFLLRIKDETELLRYFNLREFPVESKLIEQKNSKQFSKWLSCYTQAFNKQHRRIGKFVYEKL